MALNVMVDNIDFLARNEAGRLKSTTCKNCIRKEYVQSHAHDASVNFLFKRVWLMPSVNPKATCLELSIGEVKNGSGSMS